MAGSDPGAVSAPVSSLEAGFKAQLEPLGWAHYRYEKLGIQFDRLLELATMPENWLDHGLELENKIKGFISELHAVKQGHEEWFVCR